ncbi:hypothetical protein K435DRAFT_865519 [Dendrothele bispora CBS 962.96]|uniref:Uncharacterized protein n=1 Tax=Dendrothele bispora (strain CBS 962.96) TaxID=1314807 RepID=A0A4V4HE01_DENBC|nr:hypothetical protein K435DRAFT_865519 [Dendrothele bispora CBS 962.96]
MKGVIVEGPGVLSLKVRMLLDLFLLQSHIKKPQSIKTATTPKTIPPIAPLPNPFELALLSESELGVAAATELAGEVAEKLGLDVVLSMGTTNSVEAQCVKVFPDVEAMFPFKWSSVHRLRSK